MPGSNNLDATITTHDKYTAIDYKNNDANMTHTNSTLTNQNSVRGALDRVSDDFITTASDIINKKKLIRSILETGLLQNDSTSDHDNHDDKLKTLNETVQALNNTKNHIDDKHRQDRDYREILNYFKIGGMSDLFRLGSSLAVIFGGLIPYIPQYMKIKRTNSSDGFSTYVCLTLLLANILRILFYVGHPFELPLLIQSFVMIAGMLAMMEICVRVNRTSMFYNITPINNMDMRHRRISSNMDERFWEWSRFSSYIKFLVLFFVLTGSITVIMRDNHIFVECLGFVAIFTEAILGVPQVLRNHRKKSTTGMSLEMVVMWLTGDVFKTIYFVVRETPPQFYICGGIQVLVDILILWQVFWYRGPRVSYWRLPKTG